MTPTLADNYRKARADGTPARYALTQARTFEAPPAFPFTYGAERFTIERDGFRIVVRSEQDEYVSLDDLGYGRFSGSAYGWRDTGWQSRPEPSAIRCHNGNERDGNTWYVPGFGGQSMAQVIADHRKAGASRSVALDMARADARHELRMVDPGQYGPDVRCVKVTAYRNGIELAEDSVCGIEVGGDGPFDWDAYWLSEVANDLIPQVLDTAKAALAGLCAPEGCA